MIKRKKNKAEILFSFFLPKRGSSTFSTKYALKICHIHQILISQYVIVFDILLCRCWRVCVYVCVRLVFSADGFCWLKMPKYDWYHIRCVLCEIFYRFIVLINFNWSARLHNFLSYSIFVFGFSFRLHTAAVVLFGALGSGFWMLDSKSSGMLYTFAFVSHSIDSFDSAGCHGAN